MLLRSKSYFHLSIPEIFYFVILFGCDAPVIKSFFFVLTQLHGVFFNNVCWFSRTQKCVTLSTTEAEDDALGDAEKDLLFLRQVWSFMLPSKVMPCFPFF